MGLFDLFAPKEEREKNALRKLAQKVTQRYGPPENRQKAIQQLGDMGTPAACDVLCLRFTIRTDPGITDDEEKETVRGLLVGAGDKALGPVKEFLNRQETGVAWGLRVLAQLMKPEELIGVITGLLTEQGKQYTRDPEKKLVLLGWLMEHRADDARIVPAALPLLEDFVDDVRIAAAGLLARQSPSEPAREGLIQLLLRDKENARVRGAVLQALCELGADVKGYRPSVEAILVEPFFLDKEGKVKKRGG
jgi:hypothetical protein